MSILLPQAAAATVVLGPFVDSTDGVTAETALTIAQADIRLSKNGAAFAQTDNTAGATHMENGFYSIPLNSNDIDTLGRLVVAVSESGALPVWREYHVVPTSVYGGLVSGTDFLQVDTREIGGTTQTANDVGGDVNAILLDTAEIGAAGAGLTEAGGTGDHLTALATAASLTNLFGALVQDSVNDASATSTSFTVTTSVGSDIRVGMLRFTSGTLDGESRLVSWTGTTVTVLSNSNMPAALKQFSAAPGNSTTFDFRPL